VVAAAAVACTLADSGEGQDLGAGEIIDACESDSGLLCGTAWLGHHTCPNLRATSYIAGAAACARLLEREGCNAWTAYTDTVSMFVYTAMPTKSRVH
jgi:hypothetical protein